MFQKAGESAVDTMQLRMVAVMRLILASSARARPHLVLLYLDLGDHNGLDFLSELFSIDVALRVLGLTGVRDAEMHRKAVRLGAIGW